MNLLDGIVNAILGPDTSTMSEADRKKTEAARAEDRSKATSAAYSASQNPGMAMMRPETSGFYDSSKSLGDSIASIMKLFGGGAG